MIRQIFSMLRLIFFFISLFNEDDVFDEGEPCPVEPPVGGGLDLYDPIPDRSPAVLQCDPNPAPEFNPFDALKDIKLTEPIEPPTFNLDPESLVGTLNPDQFLVRPPTPSTGINPDILGILANLNDEETNNQPNRPTGPNNLFDC